MTNDEYIQQYPHQFKDELDKWLFREFGIMAGACSSVKEMEYNVAREVAQKAMKYAKQEMMEKAESLLVGIDVNGLSCVHIEGVLPDEIVKVIIIKDKEV